MPKNIIDRRQTINCVFIIVVMIAHTYCRNISNPLQIYTILFCFRQLGLTEMFLPTADFSELSSSGAGKLRVSSMKHKTYVDVNEKGTEAAAVTGKSLHKSLHRTLFEIFQNLYFFFDLLIRFCNRCHHRELQSGIRSKRHQESQVPRVSSVLVHHQERQRHHFHGQTIQPDSLKLNTIIDITIQ